MPDKALYSKVSTNTKASLDVNDKLVVCDPDAPADADKEVGVAPDDAWTTFFQGKADARYYTQAQVDAAVAAAANTFYLGTFVSLAALQTAHPDPGGAGFYALVDAGAGVDVVQYTWDVDDAQYVETGQSPAVINTAVSDAQTAQTAAETAQTAAETAETNANDAAAAALASFPGLGFALMAEADSAAVAAGVITFHMPYAMTLNEVILEATSTPAGGDDVADLKKAGVSVLSAAITAGDGTDFTSVTGAGLATQNLPKGSKMTVDFTAVAPTPGKGYIIWLIGTPS